MEQKVRKMVGRPKKVIANKLRKKINTVLSGLTLADQLVPLMFEKDHLAVLLSLKQKTDGLTFSLIGDVAGLGRSQKLVDILNHLVDYRLIDKQNGNYTLSDYGLSAANFAERFIKMITSDPNVARNSPIAAQKAVIEDIEQKYEESLKKRVKESPL